MKAIKWMNMSIVIALCVCSMIMMCVNTESAFSWCDVLQVLGFSLMMLAFALFAIMYKNNVLPKSIEKLLDDIMKED